MVEITSQRKLYEQDLVAWCEDTVAKLRAGHLDEVDIDSLIEEIEGLAGRDRRELESRLEILLYHLLKRIYIESANDYRGWELTIREQRRQIQKLLKQSPSLRNYFAEVFPDVWENVLADAREDYPQVQFPNEWRFSRELDVLLVEKLWELC